MEERALLRTYALAKSSIPEVGRSKKGATTCIHAAVNDTEVCHHERKYTEHQVKIISPGKNKISW